MWLFVRPGVRLRTESDVRVLGKWTQTLNYEVHLIIELVPALMIGSKQVSQVLHSQRIANIEGK